MVSFMTLQNSMDERKLKTIRHLITLSSMTGPVCVCQVSGVGGGGGWGCQLMRDRERETERDF